MKKTLILVFFCAAVILQAQVKFKVGSIGKDEKSATGPADLVAQLSFKDENGNGILENRERATVTVKITNKGIGNAEQIKVSLPKIPTTPTGISMLTNRRRSMSSNRKNRSLSYSISSPERM